MDIDDEREKVRTVFSLAQDKPIDLFAMRRGGASYCRTCALRASSTWGMRLRSITSGQA